MPATLNPVCSVISWKHVGLEGTDWDAAAEDMRDSPRDVSVPLTKTGAGKPVAGQRYVAGFTYGL